MAFNYDFDFDNTPFKTPEIAKESSEKIYQMFLGYKEENDLVGMDMARKFRKWATPVRAGTPTIKVEKIRGSRRD